MVSASTSTAERSTAQVAWNLVDRVNGLGQGLHPDTFIDRRNGIGRDLAVLARRLSASTRTTPLVVHLGGLSRREAMTRAAPAPGSALDATGVFASLAHGSEAPKAPSLTVAAPRGRIRRKHRYPMPPRSATLALPLL
jgi:hypothetical protein